MKNLTMIKLLFEHIECEKLPVKKVGLLQILSFLISACCSAVFLYNLRILFICWYILGFLFMILVVWDIHPQPSILQRYTLRICEGIILIFQYILIFGALCINKKIFIDNGINEIAVLTLGHLLIILLAIIIGIIEYYRWRRIVFCDDVSLIKPFTKMLDREKSYHQKCKWYGGLITIQVTGIISLVFIIDITKIYSLIGLALIIVWSPMIFLIETCIVSMLKIKALKNTE